MEYKCKENDAVIEINRSKDELLIRIDGEPSSTIIGLKDLFFALKEFGFIANKDMLAIMMEKLECEVDEDLIDNMVTCETCGDEGFVVLSDGKFLCPDCNSL